MALTNNKVVSGTIVEDSERSILVNYYSSGLLIFVTAYILSILNFKTA